ncbi:AI-2E family transporter [Consotaella salsifontis]|uniref:Predicted PurR-regulated permease PerM n=1 Tax=Consotaella salsifontis TaxID=1365950 RepID=A0A1T4P2T9_9HYPH|nr:AI-2E family transporter [Consotaella salsifontis]SJZ85835.1 Predicted PurR-regulated permease PerM [Consotaella salsifontis]
MTTDRALSIRRQILFWSLAAVVLVLLLWVFSGILLPFVLGMAIAYFLDPVADWLVRRGLSRVLATVAILVVFAIILIAVIVILVPVVSHQVGGFLERVPDYIRRLQELITTLRSGRLAWLFESGNSDIQGNFAKLASDGASIVTRFIAQLWTSSMAVVNFASLFVVTPVVAFYMLIDWDAMLAKIDGWVPRPHVVTVRRLAREIDRSVAGFVRGQSTVCLLLGTFYAVGLSLVGVNFGLLIGLFAGFVSFIPYIGSMLGLVLSVGIALVQFWPDWIWVIATAGVFFVGQFIEGNILQPKLVGASVGLHPVWLMFALFAFGALFGFVGLLIAVPASAAIGVLARFAIGQYLESEMYRGPEPLFADEPPRIEGEDAGIRRAIQKTFTPKGNEGA